MERIPKQGEFYRHFKNKLYQIVAVAEHTENKEALVVYQALYGDFRMYARPLEMFVSEVDREKYPQVTQRYRFERVELSETYPTETLTEGQLQQAEEALEPNQYLMEFLEAKNHEMQMEALTHMKGHVSQEEVDSICLVLDIPQGGKDSIEQQLRDIERHLATRNRYDGSRLR